MILDDIATTPLERVDHRPPVRVSVDTPVGEVVRALVANARGSAVVEDAEGRLQGIFTERDVLVRLTAPASEWRDRPVSDVMTAAPRTMRASDSIMAAMHVLREGGFRTLPVVDNEGQVIAIVTVRDLLSHIAEYFPDEFFNLPPDPDHEATGQWGG